MQTQQERRCDDYVECSFQVLFIDDADTREGKEGCREDRRLGSVEGGGGGGLKVISPLDGGGQEVILTLIRGGGVQLYFKAYFANFRTPPPDNYCTVPKLELYVHAAGVSVLSLKITLLSSRCLGVVPPFTCLTTDTFMSWALSWSARLECSATGKPPP